MNFLVTPRQSEFVHNVIESPTLFAKTTQTATLPLSFILSPRLASISPKPQPTPPRNNPREILQAYIFPWKILHIINIRKDGIEICTGLLTEEIRA